MAAAITTGTDRNMSGGAWPLVEPAAPQTPYRVAIPNTPAARARLVTRGRRGAFRPQQHHRSDDQSTIDVAEPRDRPVETKSGPRCNLRQRQDGHSQGRRRRAGDATDQGEIFDELVGSIKNVTGGAETPEQQERQTDLDGASAGITDRDPNQLGFL